MADAGDAAAIAEATETDVTAFADFLRTAWREAGPEAPGFAGGTDAVIAQLTTPEAISARIGGPRRRMYLAWDGNSVVGFSATTHMDDATIELAGVIVLARAAGRGIGTRLVAAAVAAAATHGYGRMIVRTEVTNDRAR
ncbi:MAG: GNAT family N-acetyltransferase, partial [Actinobacteria bacterium]|nr:GNAT family N-acetyltransferase [Actinomycetota bacterium]NIS32644.1 GNAT family N-acetyltransferase [Actinomycetota bacterium]NIU67650.1 GNAT family N-acetyltransferase [Actinomycetota bacterium]NIV88042.1 GNAT family N-acetyltransferase [Actinomycetota bacterium]NIW29418.1 GNAT family N-acetyltransferase [Actinomycetota bacterium]